MLCCALMFAGTAVASAAAAITTPAERPHFHIIVWFFQINPEPRMTIALFWIAGKSDQAMLDTEDGTLPYCNSIPNEGFECPFQGPEKSARSYSS